MSMQSTSFWDFSNQLYDREGVANACLRLQDEHQLDVNLLLFCCWIAHFENAVTNEAWQKILDFSNEWNANIVHPLRSARRWMKNENHHYDNKTEFSVLRERIKLDELAAEKFQQEFIEDCLPNLPVNDMEFSEERSKNYLTRLLEASSIEKNTEIEAQFSVLVKAITESA